MRNNSKGEVATLVLVVLALAGASQLVPNLRISNWFKKGPPTEELQKAQKEAADAKAVAAGLQARVDAIKAADEAKKTEQLTYTHEMVTGAIESNAKAPESTERAITDAFLQRADLGFNTAIGRLDPALREEVIGIVAQLRSGDQEKIKAANAMLAEKDKELARETAARVKLEADAVVVKEKLAVANNVVAAKAANETKLTAQVVSYANKSYEKEKEAGSLGAFVDNLLLVVAVVVVIALILGGMYWYRRLRSVGPVTLGRIIGDIRAGTDPTVAFDTHLNASLHPAVAKVADAVKP